MKRRTWQRSARPELPPDVRARLEAWVAYLDVDLELAQTTLRLPPDQLPPLPQASPSTQRLRGAYARRAKSV